MFSSFRKNLYYKQCYCNDCTHVSTCRLKDYVFMQFDQSFIPQVLSYISKVQSKMYIVRVSTCVQWTHPLKTKTLFYTTKDSPSANLQLCVAASPGKKGAHSFNNGASGGHLNPTRACAQRRRPVSGMHCGCTCSQTAAPCLHVSLERGVVGCVWEGGCSIYGDCIRTLGFQKAPTSFA